MASNLIQATREMVDKTWRSMVTRGNPLLTRLEERSQVIPGGLYYEQLYESADFTSLVQEYGSEDGLSGGSKEFIEKPKWYAAKLQCPIEETVDERIMNRPKGDTQLIALRDKIAKGAVQAIKNVMAARIYGCAVDNEISGTETYMQGLCSALYPCESTSSTAQTYGGIARTSTSHTEWRAADDDNWDTSATISKAKLDEWLDAVMEFDADEGTYLILMGPTLYRRLKQEMEAFNVYAPKANRAQQGFDSMTYNGVEIAKDYLLDRMTYTGSDKCTLTHRTAQAYGGSASTTTSAGLVGNTSYAGTGFVFILNLDTWHLRYYEDPDEGYGPFEITEPFNQSQIAGGKDKTLCRAFWKGNLTCDAPNRNMMRANVS